MGKQFWTEEKVARLKQLRLLDHDCEFIAADLGTQKANVNAKLNRLGLPFARLEPRVYNKTSSGVLPSLRARAEPAEVHPSPQPAFSLPQVPPSPISWAKWPVQADSVPLARLRSTSCRFPLGESRPVMFCGRKAGPKSAYCAEHHRVCYQPLNARPLPKQVSAVKEEEPKSTLLVDDDWDADSGD